MDVGQRVRILPEYRDGIEADEVYVVTEDNGDRLLIQPVNCTMSIIPTELVRDYMVCKA